MGHDAPMGDQAMANEINLTASLSVFNPLSMVSPGLAFSVTGLQFSMIGKYDSLGTILVPANLSGTITNATNANPIVLTTTLPHGLVNGDTVTISLVTGNTAANGVQVVTVIDANDFSIPVAGNGSYVSGGVFSTANGAAIPLASVSQPHWAFFQNLDPANYVQLKNGLAGAVFARLQAGEPAFLPLDPSCVPYALANTSSILLQYGILNL